MCLFRWSNAQEKEERKEDDGLDDWGGHSGAGQVVLGSFLGFGEIERKEEVNRRFLSLKLFLPGPGIVKIFRIST